MKKKLIFALLAAILLTPWPVAYAYDNDMAGQSAMEIEAAEPAAAPHWNAFGNAIGGVTPGDLFYIDIGNIATDIPVTLYITNVNELLQSIHSAKIGQTVEITYWRGETQQTSSATLVKTPPPS